MQNEDMLVISNRTPALPNSNCFWVSAKEHEWYIGTFLPAVYHVPSGVDIVDTCESIFHSSPTAIYTIDENLAARLGLRCLSDAEAKQLGFG